MVFAGDCVIVMPWNKYETSKGAITANAGIAPFSFKIKEKFDMLREALPEIVTGSVPGAKAKAILDRRNE